MFKVSSQKDKIFCREIKKIYSGENFIDNNKCKIIVKLIFDFYLQNPLNYHYLHSLDRNDKYISKISLQNLYTAKQIEYLISRLEQYLKLQTQKQSVSIASEAVGFSALAILISFGGTAIIGYSINLSIIIVLLLLVSVLVYTVTFWVNKNFIPKIDNVIALLQHFNLSYSPTGSMEDNNG